MTNYGWVVEEALRCHTEAIYDLTYHRVGANHTKLQHGDEQKAKEIIEKTNKQIENYSKILTEQHWSGDPIHPPEMVRGEEWVCLLLLVCYIGVLYGMFQYYSNHNWIWTMVNIYRWIFVHTHTHSPIHHLIWSYSHSVPIRSKQAH